MTDVKPTDPISIQMSREQWDKILKALYAPDKAVETLDDFQELIMLHIDSTYRLD